MEEIQSKIKKIEESIEKIESEKDDAQTKIKSLEKSLGAENLDNKKREGLEAQVVSLQARLAPLDAQLAELQGRLAGYEQDLRELKKTEQYPILPEEAVYDNEYLKKSVKLAQMLMNSPRFRSIYDRDFKSDCAKEKIKDVRIFFETQIQFKRDESGRPIYDLAWTDRDDTTFICINDIFRQRLEKLSTYHTPEKSTIVFMMAVLICHEFGHIMLRWKGTGFYKTPDKYTVGKTKPEAGFYLEKELFGSTILMRLPQTTNNDWTSDMPILGLAVRLPIDQEGSKNRRLCIDPTLIQRFYKGEDVPYDDYLPIRQTDRLKLTPLDWKLERTMRPVDDFDNEDGFVIGENNRDDDEDDDFGERLLTGCNPNYTSQKQS